MMPAYSRILLVVAALIGTILIVAIYSRENSILSSDVGTRSENYSLLNFELFITGHDDQPRYRLSINEGFVVGRSPDSIELRTVYPEMDFARVDNRSRFFTPNGTLTRDALRIFIDIADVAALDPSYIFRNNNDAGRFALENTLMRYPSYARIDTNNAIKEFEKVSEYRHTNDQDANRRLIITHSDRRLSYVECVFARQCKVYTTWTGNLRVIYFFSSEHINDVVAIDSSVISLIDSFNPTPI